MSDRGEERVVSELNGGTNENGIEVGVERRGSEENRGMTRMECCGCEGKVALLEGEMVWRESERD